MRKDVQELKAQLEQSSGLLSQLEQTNRDGAAQLQQVVTALAREAVELPERYGRLRLMVADLNNGLNGGLHGVVSAGASLREITDQMGSSVGGALAALKSRRADLDKRIQAGEQASGEDFKRLGAGLGRLQDSFSRLAQSVDQVLQATAQDQTAARAALQQVGKTAQELHEQLQQSHADLLQSSQGLTQHFESARTQTAQAFSQAADGLEGEVVNGLGAAVSQRIESGTAGLDRLRGGVFKAHTTLCDSAAADLSQTRQQVERMREDSARAGALHSQAAQGLEEEYQRSIALARTSEEVSRPLLALMPRIAGLQAGLRALEEED